MEDGLTVQERIDLFLDGNPASVSSLIRDLTDGEGAGRLDCLEFLSVLSVYPGGGHNRALECLSAWREHLGLRYRLEPLLRLLRSSVGYDSNLTKGLLSLVNCLLIGAETAEQRIRIRNEFFGLKLLTTLDKIRSEAKEGSEVLQEIDRFDQMKLIDEEQQLSGPDGVDLNSHVDIFYAILRQVSGSPQEMLFLNVLQHLVQIDTKEYLSDHIWEATEKMVARLRLIESKEEAEKVLRIQTSSQLMDKLRSEGRCHCSCHQKSPHEPPTAPPSVLPPPAPPLPGSIPPPPPPAPPLLTPSEKKAGNSKPSFSELLSQKAQTLQSPEKRKMLTEGEKRKSELGSEFADSRKIANGFSTEDLAENGVTEAIPQPKIKLRTFAWNKVPVKKVVESGENLWSKAANHFKNGFSMNYEQIEELFCQSSPQNTMERQKKDSKTSLTTPETPMERKKNDQVNLLGPKRSLNVNIFLKQFRGGVDDLICLVDQCNSSDIGLEKLRGLVKILPELDEIETLTGYAGDQNRLGGAEKFFLSLIQVPNYRLRIESMLLREEFASAVDYIKPSLDAIILAAQDLKDCNSLQEVMFLVLMVGNYLNSGGYGGNAAGFRMTSLWKLVEIRANKPKMTLMHFVALQAENKDLKLLDFPSELKYLEEASKLSLDTIKSDVKSLREKTDKIAGQIEKTDDMEIKDQMTRFLDFAGEDLTRMESDLKTVECLRVELGEFFCEDVATFKLEECFKIFHTFSQRFVKAVQENNERKIQEEKAELKKRLKDQHLAKQQSRGSIDSNPGSSLSSKYAALNSSRDITLTTYIASSPERSEIIADSEKSEVGSTKKLVEILESKSRASSIPNSSGTNWDMVDSLAGRRFARRRGSQTQLAANERERETPKAPPTTAAQTANWRDRVDQLLREDEAAAKSQSDRDEQRENKRMSLDLGVRRFTGASGNIDKPQEYFPTFARTRLAQRESAWISSSSDLRTSPQSNLHTGNESGGEENKAPNTKFSSVGRRERDRRAQSMYGSNSALRKDSYGSAGKADDLNELLSSLETEKRHHEIMSLGRKYKWRESAGPEVVEDMSQDQPKNPRTDIDEIVRHCEKTREEIEKMGVEEEGTWGRGKMRSVRDSGIEEGIVHLTSPIQESQDSVSFTFTTSVDNTVEEDEGTMLEVEADIFVHSAEASCVLAMPEKSRMEESSDGENWRSVTDVSAPSTSDDSHAGSVGDKDEGFETESQSTVCSVDQILLQQSQMDTENVPEETTSHGESAPSTSTKEKTAPPSGSRLKKQPSYLAGTKASSAKGSSSGSSTPKIARNSTSQSPGLMKRFVNTIASAKKGGEVTKSLETTVAGSSSLVKMSESNLAKKSEGNKSGTLATQKNTVRSRAAANRPAAKPGTSSSSSSQNASPSRTPTASSSNIRKPLSSAGGQERKVGREEKGRNNPRQSPSGGSSQIGTTASSKQRLLATKKQASLSSDNGATESKEKTKLPEATKQEMVTGQSSKRWERLLSPPKSRTTTTTSVASPSIKSRAAHSLGLTGSSRFTTTTLPPTPAPVSRVGSGVTRGTNTPATQKRNTGFGSSTADRFSRMWRI